MPTNFPYVRQGGLLRIEVFTYSPAAEPEYAITFDAHLAHISDDDPCWEDSDSFSLFVEQSIWHELCPTLFQGLQELPIHRGDLDPPIGCSRFLQETWARGVCVSYVVGWPEGWEVRLPASSSSPSSSSMCWRVAWPFWRVLAVESCTGGAATAVVGGRGGLPKRT